MNVPGFTSVLAVTKLSFKAIAAFGSVLKGNRTNSEHKYRDSRILLFISFFSLLLLEMFSDRNQSVSIIYFIPADAVFVFKYAPTQSAPGDDPTSPVPGQYGTIGRVNQPWICLED